MHTPFSPINIQLSPSPPPGSISFSQYKSGQAHKRLSSAFLDLLLVSDASYITLPHNFPVCTVTLVGWLHTSENVFQPTTECPIPDQRDIRPIIQAMSSQYSIGNRYALLSIAGE